MGLVITSLTVFFSFVSNLAAAAVNSELIYQAITFQDVVQSSNHCVNSLRDPLVEIHVREQVNTEPWSRDDHPLLLWLYRVLPLSTFCQEPCFYRIYQDDSDLDRYPLLGACNSHNKPMQRHFSDQSIFRYFPREIGQSQSTLARFGKNKTMRPHVNMSTSCRHVNISPRLCLQLVPEVSLGILIRDKFKLKIDWSVKTPWQEYGVVAGS